MATLEVGFRSPVEYGTKDTKGLAEKHLYLGRLYVGMFSLETDDPDRQVAREVCRIIDYDNWDEDVSHIGLRILDADLRTMSEGWAVFEGRRAEVVGNLSIDGLPVEACYLRSKYFGYMDSTMQAAMRYMTRQRAEEQF